MSLALKIMLFIGMGAVGIVVGAILAEIMGLPKGGFPAIIGVLFSAGSWMLASRSKKSSDKQT